MFVWGDCDECRGVVNVAEPDFLLRRRAVRGDALAAALRQGRGALHQVPPYTVAKGYLYTVCIYTYRHPFVDTTSKLAIHP
jgi:hypothetical protein